jgi:hypothetical protein
MPAHVREPVMIGVAWLHDAEHIDAPAWVISSPIDFSKSSMREPISSIRVMIASDMSWKRDCCARRSGRVWVRGKDWS